MTQTLLFLGFFLQFFQDSKASSHPIAAHCIARPEHEDRCLFSLGLNKLRISFCSSVTIAELMPHNVCFTKIWLPTLAFSASACSTVAVAPSPSSLRFYQLFNTARSNLDLQSVHIGLAKIPLWFRQNWDPSLFAPCALLRGPAFLMPHALKSYLARRCDWKDEVFTHPHMRFSTKRT